MNKSESKYFNTAIKMDLALISLLKTKPLDYITVSEICSTAKVNRSTFYLHYDNIGDLLNETTKYLFDSFQSYYNIDVNKFVRNIKSLEANELNFICEKYLTPYLTFIKENKEIFATALSNMKSFDFEKVYKQMFEHIFNPILERFNYSIENRKYVMTYYLNGLTGIIVEWLKNDCKKSIEDIEEIIKICIFGLNGEISM